MATQLRPQTLDIEITKITAKRVYYKLWANKAETFWEIPTGSTFNTSVLVIGVRYNVYSNVVVVPKRIPKTRKFVRVQRFDWFTATAVAPKIKLQARTQKQRLAAQQQAVMPVVDDGELFSW